MPRKSGTDYIRTDSVLAVLERRRPRHGCDICQNPDRKNALMRTFFATVAMLVLGQVLGDIPPEKINADIGRFMAEKRYNEIEAYIAKHNIEALKTNLLFKGLISVKRGRPDEAIAHLTKYVEHAPNRDKAFEEALNVGAEDPAIAAAIREFAVSKLKLNPPKSAETKKRLQQLLAGDDLGRILQLLDANRALIESDIKAAYSEINIASLRHLTLATRPENQTGTSGEQKRLHGELAEGIFRFLEKVDPVRYASIEGQCQLASILQTRGEYGRALEILTTLRQFKGDALDSKEGEIDLLSAVCLEETGMKDRAKALYSKIIKNRENPRFSSYAEAAHDRLTWMQALEGSLAEKSESKGMGLMAFLGVTALIGGLATLIFLKGRKTLRR